MNVPTEYENEPVFGFIGKCEKIEDQELLDTVARSLSEGMQTGKEKVKKAEKIKIAKDLVK